YVPISALSGLLLVIAYGLVDWRYMLRVTRSNPTDAGVLICTLVVACTAPLQFAVLFGVLINIGLFLRTISHLHLNELFPVEQSNVFGEREVPGSASSKIVFLQLEGDLFFGVADELRTRLMSLLNKGQKFVIFRLRRT